MRSMARGGVPKPPEERADERMLIALRKDQKEAYKAAAEYEGLSLSSWVKMICDRAAARSAKKNSR